MRSSSANEKSLSEKFLKPVALGLLFGAVVVFILLLIFSAVMKHNNIPQSIVPVMAIVSVSAGGFTAGFAASKLAKERGLLIGLVCGAVISAVILAAGLAVLKDSVGGIAFTKFAACIAASCIGGIAGVNGKRRR